MLLANLNVTEGLVNGSRGVVIEFVTLKEAQEYLNMQAALRGAGREEDSIAAGELRVFANGNESMLFPRVLFELKNTTREVCSWVTLLKKVGDCYSVYVDCTIRLATRSVKNSDSVDDGLGFDNT